MGGREVLAEIKRHPWFRSIPVVVLTSSDAEQDISKSYQLGANCYVTKPVGLQALPVHRALGRGLLVHGGPAAMTAASGRGRRILLVEDNRGDAGLVVELMARRRQTGDELVQVATLAAALDTLRAQPVQVVLLDLRLPDGSGEACVTRLRSEAGPVPIVALTGNDDEALALRCIAAGAPGLPPKRDMHAGSLRRAIELAIARMDERLERQRADALQARLAAIVESSRDAIVSCSVDGHITSWNHAAEQLFGYTREHAMGRRVGEVIRPQGEATGTAGERRFFQPRRDAGPSGAEEVVRLRADRLQRHAVGGDRRGITTRPVARRPSPPSSVT